MFKKYDTYVIKKKYIYEQCFSYDEQHSASFWSVMIINDKSNYFIM